MILTKSNYFSPAANKAYMSVSQFKAFEKCEASAMAELKGKYARSVTTPMLVGSYVDAFYEGTLEPFKTAHPEIFTAKGTLKADFAKADEIIARTLKDKLFQKYMSGEKQVVLTGEIAGVKVKTKIDSLHSNKIVDLKVMKDMDGVYVEEQGKIPFFEAWEYDLQGAIYQEVVRQNTGKKVPFYLAVATREEFTDIEIIEIEQEMLDFALNKFIENAPSYDAIKQGIVKPERCGKCEFCRTSKKLKTPLKSSEFGLF